jgi:NADH-quinone oxidoreductase subunit E
MDQAFQALLDRWKGVKGSVIPLLQQAQELLGYLPEEAMRDIAAATGRSPAEICGVATFYAQFRFKPMGRHNMKVTASTRFWRRSSA